ncbi:MAG: O-methyltransferase [Gemmatimonadetes bacterium]|nr:O-methyltransferase [Gemmatimonadota bacterium]
MAKLERYIEGRFAFEDDHLRAIREAMEREELPTIQLPRISARLLQLLLRAVGARRVLEVGTLAGYSALWIARSLPSDLKPGEGLLTLEREAERAALARTLLGRAGVSSRVEVREGEARSILPSLPSGSFDAVFLDADKEGLVDYVVEAKRLLRHGGLLVVDNALWRGQVLDPGARDPATEGIRRTHELLAGDPGFDATIVPVGDGLLIALRC